MNWKLHNRLEKDFERSMRLLYRQIVVAIGKETDPNTISRKLKIISNQPEFHRAALSMAFTMTKKVDAATSKPWREAARTAGRGNDIYASIIQSLGENPDRFFEMIRENAEYIRSVPEDVAEWITRTTQAESLKGRRASDIAEDISKKYPYMLESKAQLIARTEVSKTQLALTQAKSESLGIDWYVWRTAMDGRRRDAHADMEGVLVAWDDLPSPEVLFPRQGVKAYGNYHSGGTFNCRCHPEPVVTLSQISFPAKVHRNGKIKTMTRAEFERLIDKKQVAA